MVEYRRKPVYKIRKIFCPLCGFKARADPRLSIVANLRRNRFAMLGIVGEKNRVEMAWPICRKCFLKYSSILQGLGLIAKVGEVKYGYAHKLSKFICRAELDGDL